MKKKYILVISKSFGQNKLQHGVPVVLYRKKGKFYIDHSVTDRCLMYGWQAMFWQYVFILFGGRFSQKFFAYKKVTGFIRVVKIY